MNNIEEFLKKLTNETLDKNIKWITNTNSPIKNSLSNPNDIYRIYQASLKNCNVFLIMQTTQDYSPDFNVLYDSSYMYIVIQSENNISEITTSDVANNMVSNLYSAINDYLNNSVIKDIQF